MILNCPACGARFLIADALIPRAGRAVRCGACTKQWHVENPDAPEEPPPAPPAEIAAPEGETAGNPDASATPAEEAVHTPRSLPVVIKPPLPIWPFKLAVPLLLVGWLSLALMTYSTAWMDIPGLREIYRTLGITPTSGLKFSKLTMEREAGERKTKFILTGEITNTASVPRVVPTVRVALLSKQGETVWSREYPVDVTLKAAEVYPFRIANAETAFADKVATITLDLGNPLELMLRP